MRASHPEQTLYVLPDIFVAVLFSAFVSGFPERLIDNGRNRWLLENARALGEIAAPAGNNEVPVLISASAEHWPNVVEMQESVISQGAAMAVLAHRLVPCDYGAPQVEGNRHHASSIFGW
jgi:hypothetical protein